MKESEVPQIAASDIVRGVERKGRAEVKTKQKRIQHSESKQGRQDMLGPEALFLLKAQGKKSHPR